MFGVVLSPTQSISTLRYVEPMKMVWVTIWPSKGHNGPTSDLLSVNNGHISRTVMCLGNSGHLGAVLCRDYENGLGDHMAI